MVLHSFYCVVAAITSWYGLLATIKPILHYAFSLVCLNLVNLGSCSQITKIFSQNVIIIPVERKLKFCRRKFLCVFGPNARQKNA